MRRSSAGGSAASGIQMATRMNEVSFRSGSCGRILHGRRRIQGLRGKQGHSRRAGHARRPRFGTIRAEVSTPSTSSSTSPFAAPAVTLQLDEETVIETGRIARQSDAAVMATRGGTTVLVTVCSEENDIDADFVPLQVPSSMSAPAQRGRAPILPCFRRGLTRFFADPCYLSRCTIRRD